MPEQSTHHAGHAKMNAPPTTNTTSSLPGGVSRLCLVLVALGIPFLIYGGNTLFFFLYTWPFFLALMPVAVGGWHRAAASHAAWPAVVERPDHRPGGGVPVLAAILLSLRLVIRR